MYGVIYMTTNKVKKIAKKKSKLKDEKILTKEKIKIAIETYLNVFPYVTNLQITQFLEKSSLAFPTGVSSQKVGAICRESPKIGFKYKGNVKYYFIEG